MLGIQCDIPNQFRDLLEEARGAGYDLIKPALEWYLPTYYAVESARHGYYAWRHLGSCLASIKQEQVTEAIKRTAVVAAYVTTAVALLFFSEMAYVAALTLDLAATSFALRDALAQRNHADSTLCGLDIGVNLSFLAMEARCGMTLRLLTLFLQTTTDLWRAQRSEQKQKHLLTTFYGAKLLSRCALKFPLLSSLFHHRWLTAPEF